MKAGRIIIFAFLSVTLLLGQIPYRSQYCGMMKRSIDPRMLQHCMMSHATTDQRLPRFASSAKMMTELVKPIVGVFENSNRADHQTANLHIAGPFYPAFVEHTCFLLTSDQAEHPPPDIVIQNLNLRI